jgi:hypothetical protein
MSRRSSASIALLLLLLPAFALAAPTHKRHAPLWHGYGFLPGYQQPPNNTVPVFTSRASSRGPAGYSSRALNGDAPDYTPQYWYNGDWYYFGRPGFVRGRYNGGSMGPCWTYTPIGMIWNCG